MLGRLCSAAVTLLALTFPSHGFAAPGMGCDVGTWVAPSTGEPLEHAAIVAKAAMAPVVLLGEAHDDSEHHRWQLSVVAGLLGQRRDIVLGFEAFPRRAQPVLDRWVDGRLSEASFLEEVGWWHVWGFDPDLYTPLLHLARLHRIPVIALNVDRAFIAKVADDGWEAIPEAERAGVSDPARPSVEYVDVLAQSYLAHSASTAANAAEVAAAPTPEELREKPEFQRFVQAQLTWDRAMAEAIAVAQSRPGSPLVVGIIGSGHLRHGYGVPWQLADLGIDGTLVFLPHDAAAGCAGLAAGLADAVFTLAEDHPTGGHKPRLGVSLRDQDDRVAIGDVLAGSVAAAAGLQPGDVILRAAGEPIRAIQQLVSVVQRQAPGTWLPIDVRRGERSLQLVAKFPALSESAS